MPVIHPKITRVDNTTHEYELPYPDLPDSVKSPHPRKGVLVESSPGFMTLEDESHPKRRLPKYILEGDQAIQYLMDSYVTFLNGYRSGKDEAQKEIEGKISDVLGLAKRHEMEKLAERIDALESQGRDPRRD